MTRSVLNERLFDALTVLLPKKSYDLLRDVADAIYPPTEVLEIPPDWTPVEVSLPDGCDEVQLLDSTGTYGHGFHSNLDIPDDWFWHTDTSTEFTHTIIAWREFPEPESKLLKVGDSVHVTAMIIEIDETDPDLQYRIGICGNLNWIRREDIDGQREVW